MAGGVDLFERALVVRDEMLWLSSNAVAGPGDVAPTAPGPFTEGAPLSTLAEPWSTALDRVAGILEPFWCSAVALAARAVEAGERVAAATLDAVLPLLLREVAGRPGWMWLALFGVVAVLLAFDLGVMNRRKRDLSVAESYLLSTLYVLVALAFGGLIWWVSGRDSAVAFLTGYLVEKSLALDNVFVMVTIFGALAIPRHLQPAVLAWGILGVIVLRLALIVLGGALVGRYAWVLDLFAVCLILTGAAMLLLAGRQRARGRRWMIDLLRRRLRVTGELHGGRFFVAAPSPSTGRSTTWCTPLFLALLLILAADLVFAVDSVPAIFAITQDPFIVYASNLLAIVGLRALYFKIAMVMARSRYMIYALASILVLIGGEALLANVIGKVPPAWSLAATLALLGGGILFSLWPSRRKRRAARLSKSLTRRRTRAVGQAPEPERFSPSPAVPTAIPARGGRLGGATGRRDPMDHPLRVSLHHELHVRPSLDIEGAALVAHVAHLTPPEGWRGLPSALAAAAVGDEPHAPRYGFAELAGSRLKWERHTEFLTVKAVMPLTIGDPAWPVPDAVVADLLASIPGERVVALLVRVAGAGGVDLPPPAGSPDRAVASTVGEGEATVWSDLRIAGDGFARMLLLGHQLTPFRAGWTVRRLVEIETYRMMALLGLARARELQPILAAIEERLATIVGRLAAPVGRDDRGLLREVGKLSAELAVLLPGIRSRLSATQAYGQIVEERIGELREDRVPGYHRFGLFVARRFQPALRTCAATERRLDQVVEQMGQAGDLLRTRVQVELEEQNAVVLRSMERRTKAQLRLQAAVEGLSVVVLSYYVVSLAQMGAEGLAGLGLPVDPNVVVVAAIPVAVVAFALSLRRVHRRIEG